MALALLLALLSAAPGSWAAEMTSHTSLFPGPGEARPLYPGGPILKNAKDYWEFDYGQGRGTLRAFYDVNGSMLRTEERDAQGRLIEVRRYGSPFVVEQMDPKTGQITSRETQEPEKAGHLLWVREELKGGKLQETARKTLDATQACMTHTVDQSDALAVAVDQAICRGEENPASCDVSRLSGYSDATTPASLASHGVCVDTGCRIDAGTGTTTCAADGLGRLLQDTIYQGATCMAKLASGSTTTAGSALSGAASGELSKTAVQTFAGGSNLPLKNAALLLLLYNQGTGFGNTWNAGQQRGGGQTSDGLPTDVHSVSAGQARKQFNGSAGPIQFSCGNQILDRMSGGGTQAQAAALLPGEPGWPGVILRTPMSPEQLRPGTDEYKDLQSKLFHELLHVIGYPHDDHVIPFHSACAHYCFEDGSFDPRSNVDGKGDCHADNLSAAREVNRQVCSGQVTAAQLRRNPLKDRYYDNNCACFRTGDPWEPNVVCTRHIY
ncbi:MAG TPA: hypothetical protein VL588_10300 [Bdellovibrionota bacterium]|nr:hypothetical protein [Bdellovibrionota bacterium]